jgi:hypothetical protein
LDVLQATVNGVIERVIRNRSDAGNDKPLPPPPRSRPEIAQAEPQEAAPEIHLRGQRITADIIAIGQDLIEVRTKLKGGFVAWVTHEFQGWSERTAYNFIQAAEAFGEVATVANGSVTLDARALYLLAAPKVPAAVRQNAIDRAEDGERITRAEAERMIAEALIWSANGATA